MAKAFRGEAAVRLPRTSNNAGHGSLRLARRVKSFQCVYPLLGVTNCTLADYLKLHSTPGRYIFLANY